MFEFYHEHHELLVRIFLLFVLVRGKKFFLDRSKIMLKRG